MSDLTTIDRVKKVVAEQMGLQPGDVNLEHKLNEDLGADSLDAVELTMYLEDEFEIEISDEDAEKMTTVQEVVDYVSNRLAK